MKNVSLSALVLAALGIECASAQNSVFTYQGRLIDKGRAATGNYEFQFRLADAATNGNYVGPTLSVAPVPVTNGVFTVTLDFGAGVFDGSSRFLETGVRSNSSTGEFTILQPLQPITMAPYAMLAHTAVAAGVASNLVAGAVLTNLSIAGSTIQPGTITAAQIDPVTDAAYRAFDTNAILALIAQATSSSQAGTRSVDAKLVFGAKGDGVTDDTAALQAGLNAASASNQTLYLPAGTYRLSGTLYVPPSSFPQDPVAGMNTGWRISGAGQTVTKLFWPNLENGIGLALTSPLGYEGVIIEDLALVGPKLTSSDSGGQSIGLALGTSSILAGWSGYNDLVRNCAILGWGYGATATNQWILVFDNCVVASNTFEGLRFVGSHNVSVQNCRVRGGWGTACGIGIGFHPPLNFGYGDNAQVLNCLISNCTNGILNQELNLVSLNNHLEACGSYYTLVSPPPGASPPATTIIGGYTLDFSVPWTNGFAAQMLMDAPSASLTVIENSWFTGGDFPWRPFFNVTNLGSGFAFPTYLGPFSLQGLWNTSSNVMLNPLGTTPQWVGINQEYASAIRRKGSPGLIGGSAAEAAKARSQAMQRQLVR